MSKTNSAIPTPLLLFQLEVIAVDRGLPVARRSDPMLVTINMWRNKMAPYFRDTDRNSKEIRQDAEVDSDVLTVKAKDDDDKVSVILTILCIPPLTIIVVLTSFIGATINGF